MTEKDYALYGTKVLKMIFAKRTVEPLVKLVSLYLKWSVAK